jgi:hypothetical protein
MSKGRENTTKKNREVTPREFRDPSPRFVSLRMTGFSE